MNSSPIANKTLSRTVARLAAVQALYSVNTNSQNNKDLILDIVEIYKDKYLTKDCDSNAQNNLIEPDLIFLTDLTDKISANLEKIDGLIANSLTSSSFDELDLVIRSILRSAICEIALFDNIPVKVIINEYTNIAGSFVDQNEVGFVNKVLDKIGKELRPNL